MDFEWDEAKRQSNFLRHMVAFEDAADVFLDPTALTEPAETVDGEKRWIKIGLVEEGIIVGVVYAERINAAGEVVARIIYARPASRRERRRYTARG